MARWTEDQFIEKAKGVAKQHVVSKRPLTELAQKCAEEHALNPDEIRTLVRLANVAAFQEHFAAKQDGDKMVEFDVGDPEAVVRRIVESRETPVETASIHSDKLATEEPAKMTTQTEDLPQEKWASFGLTPRNLTAEQETMRRNRAIDEVNIEKLAAHHKWAAELESLVPEFRRAPGYGLDFGDFVKQASASQGAEAFPELLALADALGRRDAVALSKMTSFEKQADFIAVKETKPLETLKRAVEARQAYEKLSAYHAELAGVEAR